MKKILKIVPTVLVAILAVWLIYYFISGSYKHISLDELALMLTERVGITTESPTATLREMGAVEDGIPEEKGVRLNNEQVFSVVSRFFLLNENDGSNINYVRDSDKIETVYKLDISGLLGEKYIEKGRFHPKAKAKYKDVTAAVDRILGKYVAENGNVNPELYAGNITVNGKDVTLTGMYPFTAVMCGGKVNLTGCDMKGHIAVVTGDNTVVIDDASKVAKGIFVMKGATCRIITGDGAECKIYSSGKSELQGDAESITVLKSGNVTVNGNVQYVAMKGAGEVDYKSGTFGAVYSKTEGASIRVSEVAVGTQVSSSNEASDTEINVAGTVERVETESPGCLINIKPTAKIEVLTVYKGSDGTQLVIEKGAKTGTVTNEEENAVVVDQRSKWDGR